MLFAPDTEAELSFAVALANTTAGATKSGVDELQSIAQLAALIRAYKYTGRIDRNAAEVAGVRDTRDRLREMWLMPRDEMALAVNEILRDAGALPFLVRHDDFDWHMHATSADAPLAERMRVEVGLALFDVVRTDQADRLRQCEADDCEGLLADLSRNGSKRFCSVRCGNRVNMTAWRARQED
ncbi:MAG: CGNR zinc finger domain-containing protein [Microbacteriaceae bacterium]